MLGDDRWVEVTQSANEHEQQGLQILRRLIPDADPYWAWTNFEFKDSHGRWHEVDALVLGRERLHLVELKYYGGHLRGNDIRWLRDGHRAEDLSSITTVWSVPTNWWRVSLDEDWFTRWTTTRNASTCGWQTKRRAHFGHAARHHSTNRGGALHYAHGNKVVHRGHNPRALWMKERQDGSVTVAVGDWQSAGTAGGTTSGITGVTKLQQRPRTSQTRLRSRANAVLHAGLTTVAPELLDENGSYDDGGSRSAMRRRRPRCRRRWR